MTPLLELALRRFGMLENALLKKNKKEKLEQDMAHILQKTFRMSLHLYMETAIINVI